MSARFTPGHWRAHNLGIVSQGASCVVAVVHWRGEEFEAEDAANMHLIAAAPELYAALLQAQEYLLDIAPAVEFDANEVLLRKARGEA